MYYGGENTFPMMNNILIIALLIAFTAFFVASEFAIVKVRSTRIDQLIAEGNKRAVGAKKVISSLDEYLSACQLGITLTSLGLGWLGEPTVEHLINPILSRISTNEVLNTFLSFIIAFMTITFIHVVVGELAPKTLAIQKAETITLLTAKPLILFYRILYPFIWLLNHSANLIIGLFGLKPASENELAHSEEELRIILSESLKSGEINQSEYKYVNKIFEFDERIAKEIMVPRTEIMSVDIHNTLEEVMEIVVQQRYTRYPVINGDKDNIIGIINMKEILTEVISNNKNMLDSIEAYIHPVITVIETIPIHELLVTLQKNHSPMAILFDEYGGTAGLVTVEDIIEEIVGDIRDEFDQDELPDIRKLADNHYILDGKVLIGDVNDLLGIDLLEDDVDTIGGYILTQKYDVQQGDQISEDGYTFIVKEIDGQHILFVEVIKNAEGAN